MDPPAVSKKRTNTPQKSSKAKKVSFEASGGEALVNAMSEEELKIMQTRNRQDGFKGKRKAKEQANKKTDTGLVKSAGNS